LNPVFRYSHWAGISDYTSRFRVAVTYVVIRQLELPGHCDLPDLQAGTPSPKVTGPICRVPLTHLNPTRLHLFSEGHLCRFSVRTCISLFMDTRNLSSFPITLSSASHHYGTPRNYTLRRGDSPAQHTPMCQGLAAADTWYRNINLFPFRCTRVTVQLRTDLPSADEHCRGNLAPAAVGILTQLCFYYCQNSQFCTVHWTLRPSFCPCRTPLYEITFRCSVVSVVGFSPVHFQRPKP
jgi:hypothetical protein